MFSRRHWAAPLTVTLAVTGAMAVTALRPARHMPEAAAQPAGKAPAADQQAVREASAAYVAALTAGDPDKVVGFWAPDADYIDDAGKLTRGKDRIADLFRKALPARKGSKFAGRIESMKFLRPEVCLVDGTLEVTSPTQTKEVSRYAVVWARSGDRWLISSARDLPAEVTDLPSLAAVQLKDLGWLVGEWADARTDVTMTSRWDTNRAFLILDYTVKQEGADPLKVRVRVGWDGANARIRSWMFDSQGGFGEGYWQRDGKKWVVGASGVLPDGGTGSGTNSYEFVDANTFVWRATDREVDGQPLADAEVKFVRKNAKK